MSHQINWQLKQHDTARVFDLKNELSISEMLARLLVNRGIVESASAERFLNTNHQQIHAPFLLKDMNTAVTRVMQAIESKQKICIYGDYDVDGAVSTSLFLWFFREIEVPIEFYIPNRLKEGYSLNESALRVLKERGVNLVITVDNGIMAHKEVLAARAMKLDIIITDHHQVGDALPEAVAVVNPQRKDCTYPYKGICGAAVVFKLLMALRQGLRETGYFATRREPNLKNHLDLLAIATVCDVMPLTDENRFFVKEGLVQLAHTKKLGLRALMNVAGVRGDPTATDLGFRLGPRINACGRLDDASVGVRLLTATNERDAMTDARLLGSLNQERRDIESQISDEARAKVAAQVDLNSALGLVLFDETWHEGVVGIVASRVVDQFKRPAFVLTVSEQGLIKGSGRSVNGVSLIGALRDCGDIFVKFGGHEAAAGATLDKKNLDEFKRRFDLAIKKQMSLEDLNQTLWVDHILRPEQITKNLIEDMNRLEPFGMANAKPVFVSQGLRVINKRIVGEKHLKLVLGHESAQFDAIAFGKANQLDDLSATTDLIYGLEINEFNNVERAQLVVSHLIKPLK